MNELRQCACDRTHGYNTTGTIENGRCIKVVCNICGGFVPREESLFPSESKLPYGKICRECIANGDIKNAKELVDTELSSLNARMDVGEIADIIDEKIPSSAFDQNILPKQCSDKLKKALATAIVKHLKGERV